MVSKLSRVIARNRVRHYSSYRRYCTPVTGCAANMGKGEFVLREVDWTPWSAPYADFQTVLCYAADA